MEEEAGERGGKEKEDRGGREGVQGVGDSEGVRYKEPRSADGDVNGDDVEEDGAEDRRKEEWTEPGVRGRGGGMEGGVDEVPGGGSESRGDEEGDNEDQRKGDQGEDGESKDDRSI